MNEFNVYKSDCIEYMKSIEDNTFDCIVTSPPYNKGSVVVSNSIWDAHIDYDEYKDDMPQKEYDAWQLNVLNEIYRCIKPSGSVFYNHKVVRKGGACIFPKFVLESNFNLYQMIIWDRGNSSNIRDLYLLPTTELIFWLTKDRPKVHKNNAIYRTEVWRFPPSKKNEHPASFPLELPYNCILLTTDENDLVFDPFVGSGTTGVACKMLHRNFIGTDISENYINLANNNISRCNVSSRVVHSSNHKLF